MNRSLDNWCGIFLTNLKPDMPSDPCGLPSRCGESFSARRPGCGLPGSVPAVDGLGAAVPFRLILGECPAELDNLCRFLAGSPSGREPGLVGGEWTGGWAATGGGEGSDTVDSLPEGGVLAVLCLGVGC